VKKRKPPKTDAKNVEKHLSKARFKVIRQSTSEELSTVSGKKAQGPTMRKRLED